MIDDNLTVTELVPTNDNDDVVDNQRNETTIDLALSEIKSIQLNYGYQFWKNILKSSRYILAPMVDQSELAFRLFVRRYQVQCTYSPMFNSNIFVKDFKYRRDCLQVLPELDRPLIIQFCANKAETFLQAAEMAADYCDAIDLNLGCPQTIARRGHYGSFLQDEWKLIYDIVNLASKKLSKPITCKIRVFEDVDKTLRYAKMIESAGASLLTVHGRNRDQKGPVTGMANWDYIKEVKNSINIPVFANGNIQSRQNIVDCFDHTGADGVMSAEGLLHNPAIFTGKPFPVWDATREYVELARQYPCPFSYVRGHVFKFLHHCLSLPEHESLRTVVAKTHSLDDLIGVADQFEQYYHKDYQQFKQSDLLRTDLNPEQFPIFCCKPFYRPPPTEFNSKMPPKSEQIIDDEVVSSVEKKKKRDEIDLNENEIHHADHNQNKVKKRKIEKFQEKMARMANKRQVDLCAQCPNPKGIKCDFKCCKKCCKAKTFTEILDCNGHRFLFYTRQLEKNADITIGKKEEVIEES